MGIASVGRNGIGEVQNLFGQSENAWLGVHRPPCLKVGWYERKGGMDGERKLKKGPDLPARSFEKRRLSGTTEINHPR